MKRNCKRKSKADSSDEMLKTPKMDSELEVTGVSRSGRVRKKSSKLIDYESGAEELERPKRKHDNAAGANSPRNITFKKQADIKTEYRMEISNENQGSNSINNQSLTDSEQETNIYSTNDGFDDSSVDSTGTELEEDLLDDKLNIDNETPSTQQEVTFPRSASNATAGTSQKSLYMLEKFAKKRKNGRGTRMGRKDKGKARFSAYMLWAREVRPDLMKANPNIDFSQLSSKLSDLWATVPYTDKYMWKQKAKRMAIMARNSDNKEESNVQKAQVKTTIRKKYINKKVISPPVSKGISIGEDVKISPVLTEITNPYSANVTSSPNENKIATNDTSVKNINTQPLDVAAHLKLLGESLSIIGQRLKEHEGQIAVSGSLSVLLDTLLCSLGPLLCLTQQVEEMNGCSPDTLNSILDNIAYIMPGL